MKKYNHPYHIIEYSFFPFILSVFLFYLFFFFGCFLNGGFENFINNFYYLFYFILFLFLFYLFFWFWELITESIIEGHNTKKVNLNYLIGMILFILSEIMFFFAFFWAFFHFSLNPSFEIGACWPPVGIPKINYLNLPLINTILLLSSGVTITWSHISLKKKFKFEVILSLFITIILSFFFLRVQYIEFKYSLFTISDSVFGTIFYFITGLHGLHVIVGTLLLIVSFFRILFDLINSNYSAGFEFSVWYWHFVDIVWLFVMSIVYCWGS